MTVFDHLSIGRSAMRAFRLGMNISGYNVSNANTPGFSRRRIELGTMAAIPVPGGLVGMGVDVTSVRRIRDGFLDFSTRREFGRLGTDRSREEILSAIEPQLGDVDTASLIRSFGDFFDSLENLSLQPDSTAVRANVVMSAKDVAATIRRTYTYFDEARRNADTRVREAAGRVNTILDELRQINTDIIEQEATGAEASDLRDHRDNLVDELSTLLSVRAVEQANGQMSVFLEGTGDTLLTGVTALPLRIETDAAGYAQITIDRGGELVNVSSQLRTGELGGYLQARDEDIIGYKSLLNTLASEFATAANAIHATGFNLDGETGLDLFTLPATGDAAASIGVNAVIAADPRKLAASDALGEVGNNKIALALANLRTTPIAALANRSVVDYSADLVAQVGRDVEDASTAAAAGQTIVDSLETRRTQMSGVSLDEEAADLVRWQQAFQAAAKFLQSANSVIDATLQIISR